MRTGNTRLQLKTDPLLLIPAFLRAISNANFPETSRRS